MWHLQLRAMKRGIVTEAAKYHNGFHLNAKTNKINSSG